MIKFFHTPIERNCTAKVKIQIQKRE